MKLAFETRDIALNALVLHPDNVRAAATEAYSEAQVAALAANIRECGLSCSRSLSPAWGRGNGVFWPAGVGSRL